MVIRIVMQAFQDYWEQHFLVCDQRLVHILTIEQEQGPLSHLEVVAHEALPQSLVELLHEFIERSPLSRLKDLLYFVYKEHFFGRVGDRPCFQKTPYYDLCRLHILLNEVHDACLQLTVEEGKGLDTVEGNDCIFEEVNVLVLEGHCESRDYRAQDL